MIGVPLQAQTETEATADDLGLVGSKLEGFEAINAATASALESAIMFVVAFLALYLLGRLFFVPLVKRAFDRRELDEHAQVPREFRRNRVLLD